MRLLIVLLAGLLACAGAREARAHAVLLESTPADGAALERAPATLTLRFSERVVPIAVALRNAQGAVVAGGDRMRVTDAQIALAPAAPLADGFYVLSWRVTSADSHPVAGSITFAVGAAGDPPVLAVAPDGGWRIAATANRVLFLALAMIAGGGFLFGLLFGAEALPPRLARGLRGGALLAATAALLGIGLQGELLLGDEAGLPDAQTWRIGFDSSRGHALTLAAGALLALAAGLGHHRDPARRILGLIGLGALAASFAMSGHAATATWPAGALLTLHVALAAAWIGSFLPLRAALRRQDHGAALLRAFSRGAAPAVLMLVAAGATLAALQIERISRIDTPYGVMLLAKIVAVAGLLVLAAFNRAVLLPRLAAEPAGIPPLLRLSVGAELVVAVLILAITALLAQTVPPRALVQAPPPGFGYSQTVAAGRGTVEITVVPGRPGRNSITLRFADAAGQPLHPREATIELALPAAGVEPIRRTLRRDGDGAFTYEGRDLALEGAWSLRVDALVSDFAQVTATADLHIH